MPGKLLSPEEIRLANLWHEEDDMTPAEIAKLLRRNKSTMTRLLVKQDERTGRGQPKSLDSEQVDGLVSVLQRMLLAKHTSQRLQEERLAFSSRSAGITRASREHHTSITRASREHHASIKVKPKRNTHFLYD